LEPDPAVPRIIPIRVAVTGTAAIAEEAHVRLERAGFMRMMAFGEPRLSEFVAKYKALGYEVELVPYAYDDIGAAAACDTGAPVQDCATIYVRRRKPASPA
jgi:hypothetical protein